MFTMTSVLDLVKRHLGDLGLSSIHERPPKASKRKPRIDGASNRTVNRDVGGCVCRFASSRSRRTVTIALFFAMRSAPWGCFGSLNRSTIVRRRTAGFSHADDRRTA